MRSRESFCLDLFSLVFGSSLLSLRGTRSTNPTTTEITTQLLLNQATLWRQNMLFASNIKQFPSVYFLVQVEQLRLYFSEKKQPHVWFFVDCKKTSSHIFDFATVTSTLAVCILLSDESTCLFSKSSNQLTRANSWSYEYNSWYYRIHLIRGEDMYW